MKQWANPWIEALHVYEPGRPVEEVARELGLADPAGIVKLASNENSLGPSPKAVEAMRAAAAEMHRYPEGGGFYLAQALSERLGVPPGQIVFGNGSNELICMLSQVFLDRGRSIVMSERAFIVYHLAAAICRGETVFVPMDGFTHDLNAMAEAIREDTRLVYIANPNNPTGTMVDQAAIDAFMDLVPDHVVTVFDEAYTELIPPERTVDTLKFVREGRPAVVLRTFSKVYGLAGLRLGYAVTTPEGAELLHRVRQPFNANRMAQVAALAALDDAEYIEDARALVRDGLAMLEEGCREMGLPTVPSVVNFLLVDVGAGRELFGALQKRGVIVRPMDGYGLPDHIRVTVGTKKENERFLNALTEVLRERAT
jgi:histidinol-phosphate aminotransferase